MQNPFLDDIIKYIIINLKILNIKNNILNSDIPYIKIIKTASCFQKNRIKREKILLQPQKWEYYRIPPFSSRGPFSSHFKKKRIIQPGKQNSDSAKSLMFDKLLE